MKNFHTPTRREDILIWLQGIAVVAAFAYFFYRSPWAVIALIPLVFVYRRAARAGLRLTKQEELRGRFKEMIEIVAGNLRAGYSVENAFIETGKEMSRQHSPATPAIIMLTFIRKGIENNIPLEERLMEAGKISAIAEIIEFAEVFAVAKKSGGNTIDLIGQYAVMIGDKIETEKEISVAVSARRGEQKIMNIVPFAILLYIDFSSPGFFASLYHNPAGIAIMTACMGLYLAAYAISVRMLRIEI